jgi:thiol-disulfide isomerase/thioredoxin
MGIYSLVLLGNDKIGKISTIIVFLSGTSEEMVSNMRLLKSTLWLSFICPLMLNLASAQPTVAPVQGPEAPVKPPTFELDSAGKRSLIDFSVSIDPVLKPELKLSQFAHKKLIIFYFSASCPHCQHAAPFVTKISGELAKQGFSTIAIAIKNNSDDEIRTFTMDYKVFVPIFQDKAKQFGEKYGTGSIPLLFLVDEKGEYIRYKTFNGDATLDLMRAEAKEFAAK